MAKPKGGLGKGLGALIPQIAPNIELVAVETIQSNPRQLRNNIDREKLEELAQSIREHGLLQPLLVTELPAESPYRYQLIAGERRLQAARLAGLERVPVVIKEATPAQALEWALVENVQRADLNPLEEATAYRQLVAEFGLTQQEVAQRVGRSRAAVANSLRLLGLPEAVRAALAQGEISEGHGRALLGLPHEEMQLALLKRITTEGLSVRQTEEAVRRLLGSAPLRRRDRPRPPDADSRNLEEEFRRALGTKVSLIRSRKGGRLTVYFYSGEELERLYDLIVGRQRG